jgi:hypothetical protein
MAHERTNAHLLPPALRGAVDRLAGRHKPRRIITAALVSDRALLERQKVALARTAGILKDMQITGWETPETTSDWVRASRAEDSHATEEKLSSRTSL